MTLGLVLLTVFFLGVRRDAFAEVTSMRRPAQICQLCVPAGKDFAGNIRDAPKTPKHTKTLKRLLATTVLWIGVPVSVWAVGGQAYVVRELLAAWLFFSLVFAMGVIVVVAACLVGVATDYAIRDARARLYRLRNGARPVRASVQRER